MSACKASVLKTGTFSVSSHTQLSGTISLKGRDSELHLWANNMPYLDLSGNHAITGVLDDGKKVSLIDCVHLRGTRGQSVQYGATQHGWYFPSYVVVGPRYFSPSENDISWVSFIVDDAGILFNDRKSFGTLTLKGEEYEHLKSIKSFSKVPLTTDNPIIAYFTGKREIFSAETVIGTISAKHMPGYVIGRPDGVRITNQIRIFIAFNSPVNIHEMDRRIRKVTRFLDIVVGRPQNLVEVDVMHADDDLKTGLSSTYINMYPNHDRHDDESESHHHATLIDAVTQPAEFERSISAWLERDEQWYDARMRFSWGWEKQRSYDADRIVAAANMFDLIPDDAFPDEYILPSDLNAAVLESRKLFKSLPQSPKRDAILNAFGNIRKLSLKEKIRQRAVKISDVIGSHLPEIEFVTDRAVDLRNLYVHGDGSGRIIEGSGHSMIFLTNTLEFVFCMSDLVDSDWDIVAWVRWDKIPGHPFTSFISNYKQDLLELKSEYP